jgi:hypothetical protein
MCIVIGSILWGSLMALEGCAPERPCDHGHYDTYLQPIFNGKTTTFVPMQQFVCDQYVDQKGEQ